MNEIPTPNQFMFISDISLDKYVGMVNIEDLYMKMEIMLKCPKCSRLHIYWDGLDKPSQIHTIDG